MDNSQVVLPGLRIIDFSRAVAGAYGTLLLADLGAEVIKIEQTPSEVSKGEAEAEWAVLFGAAVSQEPPKTPRERRVWAMREAHFQSLNRNKKRICLNLQTEKGKDIFHELVKKSDVVYDNFRPHMLKRISIDFETLKQYNPKIVTCSVCGFGGTGPWRNQPCHDIIVQALGGEMSMTGTPGEPPCRSGLAIGDLLGGVYASIGILAALRRRDWTGEGQRVDMSMLDVQISLLNYRVGYYSALGEIPGPVGSGHSGGGQIPYGAYECQDGKYVVASAGSPKLWHAFCEALGLPELENDPLFSTNAKRNQNVEAITGIIEGMFLTRPAKEWEQRLFEAGGTGGMVNNIEEAMNHEQVVARDMAIKIKQLSGEDWLFAGNPIKVQGFKETYKPGLTMGADTAEVLSGILGYTRKDLDKLMEASVIWEPPKKKQP